MGEFRTWCCSEEARKLEDGLRLLASCGYSNGSDAEQPGKPVENAYVGARGTAENTIGLVRWFFSKRTDFATFSKNQIQLVERWLNHWPRKCLEFKTPEEVFKVLNVALTG